MPNWGVTALRLVAGVIGLIALWTLYGFFRREGLDGLDALSSVVGATAGVASLVLAWVALFPPRWVSGRIARAATPPPPADDDPLKRLAEHVRAVWEPEERHRRLLNPHPLPTAWTTVGPPVTDHWANVRADGRNEPLDLDGVVDVRRPDALAELVADRRLRGRVVVLGEPGAGKTALLLRLTLALLRARAPEDRVPVLLRLSTWNPDDQRLDQWVTTRLRDDYGRRRPVPLDRLLPVLDGLDELPAPRRRAALRAISAGFTPDAPLVLTCRTAEYLDTLTALDGHVLAATVVVELSPLTAEVVCGYLTRATPPERARVWQWVFDRDRAYHGGRLAVALSAPLWVDLARVGYADAPAGDPADLLNLPDADTVHARLLDRLVPAAYPDPPEPSPDGRTWRRTDATRWLSHLAAGARDRGTHDLAWWEVARSFPRPSPRRVGLVAGLVSGLVVGVAWAVVPGLLVGILVGQAARLVCQYAGSQRAPQAPSWRRIGVRRAGRPLSLFLGRVLLRGLGYGLLLGFLVYAGTAAVVAVVDGSLERSLAAFSVVFLLGFVVGVRDGVADQLSTFVTTDDDPNGVAVTDPRGLLRGDRAQALVSGSTYAFPFGVLPLVTSRSAVGVAIGVAVGLTAGLVRRCTDSAWGQFVLGRAWLAGRGQLPWRLMAFLEDAHRRGVLRQAGGVYQFRHILLRDRLADHPEVKRKGTRAVVRTAGVKPRVKRR